MSELLKKLNFKTQKSVNIINAPESFLEEINSFKAHLVVNQKMPTDKIEFCLLFVIYKKDVEKLAPIFDESLIDDGLFWWAYPKKSSKKYKSDITRDTGWEIMGSLGYEPVRMVSIDEDWSAFRMRKQVFIKNMTRDSKMLLSKK